MKKNLLIFRWSISGDGQRKIILNKNNKKNRIDLFGFTSYIQFLIVFIFILSKLFREKNLLFNSFANI